MKPKLRTDLTLPSSEGGAGGGLFTPADRTDRGYPAAFARQERIRQTLHMLHALDEPSGNAKNAVRK